MPPRPRQRPQRMVGAVNLGAVMRLNNLNQGQVIANLARLGVDVSTPREVKRVLGTVVKLNRHQYVSANNIKGFYRDDDTQRLSRASCAPNQKRWHRNPGSRDINNQELAYCRIQPKGRRPSNFSFSRS
jgi:hypothetical protein